MSLWKGRFRTKLHPEALRFSTSLPIDKRLYVEDIEGSLAHVRMLSKQKIITAHDASRISRALLQIRNEISQGKVRTHAGQRFSSEDIHMFIENRLIERIGDVGGKLHTGRSRNDQVALDVRLFLRGQTDSCMKRIRQLQRVFLAKAEAMKDVVMPGYTHLQRAQPILLAHHLLAYVSMFERDRERFIDCSKRINRSPLGAGALAGTSLPIDRTSTARMLGFDGYIENSIDAVSDRDVHLEFLSSCAITMMHLSRLAEELVLWSSQEWHFVEIGEAFTTGSSIMPQKRNPDMAELIRGKTGSVYGNLLALLTTMKGLPLAYNRDMQEDKRPLFDGADTTGDCLHIAALMVRTLKFNKRRFPLAISEDFLLATDIADYLVRKKVPFRRAHSIAGAIVTYSEKTAKRLNEFTLADFRRHSSFFQPDVLSILNPQSSLRAKQSAGSTSPKEVAKQIRSWKRRLQKEKP